MIAAVLLTAVFLALPLVLRCEQRLWLAVPLSVLQVFPPLIAVAGYHPPLALLGALSLWPEGLAQLRRLLRWPPTAVLVALSVWFAVSGLWSIDLRVAARAIVYLGVFLAIVAAVVQVAERDVDRVLRVLDATIVLALIEVVLIFLFRFMPTLEPAFFHTGIAHVLINPNTLTALFNGQGNNTLSAGKAGGLFVNGNVAGAYLWIVAMTALGLAGLRSGLWRYLIAALCLAAAVVTGSKAAFLLGLSLGIIVLVLAAIDRYRRAAWSSAGLVMVAVGLAAPLVAPYAGSVIGSPMPSANKQSSAHQQSSKQTQSLSSRSASALAVRVQIWRFGVREMRQHPWLGLGFGGWKTRFPAYAQQAGLDPGFPPHNTLIDLWARAGAPAALLGLAFIFSVALFGVRWFATATGLQRALALTIPAAFAWIFIQGMGENFGVTGDPHMAALLAALLGLGYHFRRRAAATETASP